jgi:cytochrome c553
MKLDIRHTLRALVLTGACIAIALLCSASGQAGSQPNSQLAKVDLEAPAAIQRTDLPSWAFTPPTPRVPHAPDNGAILHVPGSDRGYTRTQINDPYGPPDWFPSQHPPAPTEATQGRKPAYYACGLCHLVSGYGRPENESIAGLPVGYILEQIDDFKNGRRHSSVKNMGLITMIPVAEGITPEEAKIAAEYYASVKPVQWIHVVETNTVPKTHPNARMLAVDPNGGTEPIGNRVIEVPENLELAEMRDSASGFIAYVPMGSVKRGEELVRTGDNGKTTPCVVCHGQDLRGMGDIPPLAGRSPSQMARQIYDFKTGAHNGTNAALMKGPVRNLTDTDIVNITAYLASLKP